MQALFRQRGPAKSTRYGTNCPVRRAR